MNAHCTYLGIVMHLVLQFCVVMAFSSSSRPADFFNFLTKLLTAFSLHLSSLSAFFQPSNRLTIGGLKLGSIEVIICPETSARDPHRAAPTGLSSLGAYELYQRAIAPSSTPGNSPAHGFGGRTRAEYRSRLAPRTPWQTQNDILSHADGENFATAAILCPERAARHDLHEITDLCAHHGTRRLKRRARIVIIYSGPYFRILPLAAPLCLWFIHTASLLYAYAYYDTSLRPMSNRKTRFLSSYKFIGASNIFAFIVSSEVWG